MKQQKIDFFGALKPTGVDTSASDKLRMMAGMSKQVGDLAFNIGAKQSEKEGKLAGAEAGAEAREAGEAIEPKDSLFSIYDQSYDQAMRSAYAASADNDIREKLATIASENATDSATFNNKAKAYTKAALKGMDGEVAGLLYDTVDTQIANYSIKITEAEKQKNLTEADEIHQTGVTSNLDSALGAAFEGDFQEASNGLTRSLVLLETRLNSGKISLSEYDKNKAAMIDAVDVEANRYQFRDLLENKTPAKALQFLQSVQDQKIKSKTPKQHRNLLSILQADMRDHYSLLDNKEKRLAKEKDTFQKDNTEKLFVSMIDGELTPSRVVLAMETDQISLEQGRQLIGKLDTAGSGFDTPELVMSINETMQTDPEKAKKMIVENIRGDLSESTAVSLHKAATDIQEQQAQGGKSILTASKTKRFKKLLMQTVKVQNAFGFIDPEKQKTAAKLEVVFDERVLAGEDPADIAKDLIDVDENIDFTPRFEANGDVDNQIQALKDFWLTQQALPEDKRAISKDDFIQEFNDLEQYKTKERAINNFKKAYEEL